MILKGDIKFVASESLDDVPEGGGGPTSHVIADGVSNEIFSDISEFDRAGGNVSLRKVFVVVETNNTDTFLDANVIVAEPPTDPNVTITLFSTKSTFDTRDSARQRVEAYLTAGPEWPGFLLENHVAGQRIVQLFQRPSEREPNIGETLVLVYNEGITGELEQYVRVIDTSSVTRLYTNSEGKSYEAKVVSAELSDALRYDLPGTAPNEFFQRGSTKTKTRGTSVADAAVYCGVSETVAEVEIGDLATTVDSIFTQLVPSAQTEIPLVDVGAGGSSVAITPAGDGTVTFQSNQPFNSTTALSLSNPVQPGTLTITVGGVSLYDNGGQLFDGATAIGTIDYSRGTILFAGVAAPYTGTKTVSFKAAAAPAVISDTAQVPVTPESRSFNYIKTIEPVPAPGSVQISYRAQGRWYDLRDNGGGVLRGTESAYGVGSINYTTGAISVTLGALPDDGSSILYSWGTKNTFVDRSTMTVASTAVQVLLPDAPIAPDTVVVTWNDGASRTANDNGKGVFSGDATGTIDYETGIVKLAPTALPLGGTEYSFAYSLPDEVDVQSIGFSAPTRNVDTTVTLDLGQTNVTPGTVKLSYLTESPATENGLDGEKQYLAPPRAYAHDNGLGSIIGEIARVAGTIDYATGIITFQPDGAMIVRRTFFKTLGVGYTVRSAA